MRRAAVLAGVFAFAFWLVSAGPAAATCGEECDSEYASAIDSCKLLYGDDPADAADLANCIREARDDYRSCLDNCTAENNTPAPERPTPVAWRGAPICASGLSAQDAAKHVGENATVCGVVASSHYAPRSRSQPTLLNLDRPYPNQPFTAVIFGNDRSKFGEPERLQGRHICVSGLVQLYRGSPQIILHDPGQLDQRYSLRDRSCSSRRRRTP